MKNGVTFMRAVTDPDGDVGRRATKNDFAVYKQGFVLLRPDSFSPLALREGPRPVSPAEETRTAQDVRLSEALGLLLIQFQEAKIGEFIRDRLQDAESTSPKGTDESKQAEHLVYIKEFIRQFTEVFGG